MDSRRRCGMSSAGHALEIDSPNGLRSGQVAAAAGINPQTLRYYERRGLLDEPTRTLGGHRVYPPDTVMLLRVIKAAQRLGFTLDEVAELIDTATHRHGRRRAAGLQASALAKLGDVEQKIADLSVIRDTLREAVAAGCEDLVACASDPCCPFPFSSLATDLREPDHGKA
jgi:DNA-binding transcriptional MerR regulator